MSKAALLKWGKGVRGFDKNVMVLPGMTSMTFGFVTAWKVQE